MAITTPVLWITFSLTLTLALLGLIGGILLIRDKTAGAILAVIAGTVCFILTWVFVLFPIGATASIYFIDIALLIAGGTTGLIIGPET
ncbi:MAG: hypothetical protein HWN66_21140 [Candidatus Helarchaeota archaeon]|nr:hypothetical protein [Candidatus Helarchaeota archaeon]